MQHFSLRWHQNISRSLLCSYRSDDFVILLLMKNTVASLAVDVRAVSRVIFRSSLAADVDTYCLVLDPGCWPICALHTCIALTQKGSTFHRLIKTLDV